MAIGISLDEHLNMATGLISDAKAILDNPDVRAKMKKESYLGELDEVSMYKIAFRKAEEAVKILTEFKGRMLPDAEALVERIDNILNPSQISSFILSYVFPEKSFLNRSDRQFHLFRIFSEIIKKSKVVSAACEHVFWFFTVDLAHNVDVINAVVLWIIEGKYDTG